MAGTTAGTEHTLRLERRFAAARERVFDAFTKAEELKRWYAPGDAQVALAEVDLRVGGEWRLHMRGADGTVYRLRCEYREVKRPSRLVFTWRWEHEEGAGETVVTLEFEENDDGTLVKLEHAGFGGEQEKSGHADGWSSTFDKLAKLL